jgi:radical SAM-linked protein
MAPDTPETIPTPAAPRQPGESIAGARAGRGSPDPANGDNICDKIRIRFRKSGTLRLLSHHDLLRAFERMLRRAALPMRNTQGFHPKPRIVFALSLPLGVIGCEEVVELELSQVLPLDELQQRLIAQCPPGLELLSFLRIAPRAGAQVRALTYRIALPPERVAAVQERIAAVLAAGDCWVERSRPPARRVDLRPFLRVLQITAAPVYLEMDLWLTPQGTARPEEVLTLLGINDLLDAGAVLERARLELTDDYASPALQENTSPSSAEGIA